MVYPGVKSTILKQLLFENYIMWGKYLDKPLYYGGAMSISFFKQFVPFLCMYGSINFSIINFV